jgi:carbamoyltransferase
MAYILGINSAYHESAACLLKDGKVIAFAEEERFNGRKHAKHANPDNPDVLPVKALKFCTEKAGIRLKDVQHIGYSLLPRDRLKNIGADKGIKLPKAGWGTEEAEKTFYQKVLNVPKRLSRLAREDVSERFSYVPHHVCHAASAFFISPYKESAILVVDGIAEFGTTWLGSGSGNKISAILEVNYPNSLGFLWEKMSQFLGFTEYDACKVMGLSSYGEPEKLMDRMKKIVTLRRDGTFLVNDRIVQFRTDDFTRLERLFGAEKRDSSHEIRAIHENISASLQKMTEEVLINALKRLHKETRSKNLCMAGGVALNCVANAAILARSRFKNIFIEPASHDAGTALGAALYLWNHVLERSRTKPLRHAYYGPEYSNREIKNVLDRNGIRYKRVQKIEKVAAALLSEGEIVAWFQGRMEFGPRALGHRSILADPRSPVVRDELNRKVKFREIFRPFAPSVLEEDARKWFAIRKRDLPACYMLITYKTRAKKIKKIPAVLHVDDTARIQLVSRRTSPRYYRLIKEFKKLTGVPLVLNTSFNVQGPIVCSPQDALDIFTRGKMDYLAIGDFLIHRDEMHAE